MTGHFTVFHRLSDELLKEFGLKWLIMLLSGGACSLEKHFVILCLYTGLLGLTVRYLSCVQLTIYLMHR